MESSTDSLSHPPPSAMSSRSRSSTKIVDDVTCLTSFNPFSEEDEHDQSSYALVSSLFSKVKSTLSAPRSAAPSSGPAHPSAAPDKPPSDIRRPSLQFTNSNQSSKSGADRNTPFNIIASNPAPPLVSLTPAAPETPSYTGELDRPPSRGGAYAAETPDGGGYSIPGFPIQDSDARSIRTNVSIRRSASVSKVIRRIRGEGTRRPYAINWLLIYLQGYPVTIGWMTSFAKSVMTARVFSQHGDENTTVEYVVRIHSCEARSLEWYIRFSQTLHDFTKATPRDSRATSWVVESHDI